MKFPSIIRIPKHQRFQYEPRFYDPEKEQRELREHKIKAQIERQQAGRAQISFRDQMKRHKREDRRSNTMVLVLIAVFLLLFVLYLFA